jgi:hypothetical protein
MSQIVINKVGARLPRPVILTRFEAFPVTTNASRRFNSIWPLAVRGAKVIDRLAADLRRAFREMTGMSARNLKYMRAFAEAWPGQEFVQQVAAQLPWGHNTHLLDALKSSTEREWYARQAIHHGWSRNVLVHQIESGLITRQGSALTNFSRTLPADQRNVSNYVQTASTFAKLAFCTSGLPAGRYHSARHQLLVPTAIPGGFSMRL